MHAKFKIILELLTNNHTHVFGFPSAFLGTNSYMSIYKHFLSKTGVFEVPI